MATPSSQARDMESIAIRMYRKILGDCFLLTHQRGAITTRLLIDCGVLQGVKGAGDTMGAIADDIIKTCDGVLDVVVLTHEHYDHLSGFHLAKERFFSDQLTIKELWLAWTENPDDPQAQALSRRLTTAKTVIADIARVAAADSPLHTDPRWRTISALSKFLDPVEVAAGAEFGATGRWTNKRVIDELKKKVGGNAVRYLEPGQSARVGHAAGLRAFVLGPPRSAARLAKDRPSTGQNKEVYLTDADQAFGLATWAAANLSGAHADAGGDSLSAMPFAKRYDRKLEEVENTLQDFSDGSVERLYFEQRNRHHAIGQDWLDDAETLALKLDSDTNNTSLALAFELSDGQILLFPGDAQVGNWLSWWDQSYTSEDSRGQPATLKADEILRRVTFYKVGHHASHNATLRDSGTLKMTDPRLVAMIPVVEEVARQQGKGWLMPYPPLYEDLLRITGECVLRGDGDIDKEQVAFRNRPPSPQGSAITLDYADDQRWVQVTISRSIPP